MMLDESFLFIYTYCRLSEKVEDDFMKEDLAFQSKGFIENLMSYMYNNPYLYIGLLIGIAVFTTCRQKDISILGALAIAIVTIFLTSCIFHYIYPF